MRNRSNRNSFSSLRWISLVFLLFSLVLFILQLVRFSQIWANLPEGMKIGGVPVGMLDRQQAAQRLLEAYSTPVELRYGDASILLSPSTIGFELDLEKMLAAAELERTRLPFWTSFWDYLWGRSTTQVDVPLRFTYSEERLRNFLSNEVAARYDQPPLPAMPVVGSVSFRPGSTGTVLDNDLAVLLIENALRSTSQRKVDLPLQRTSPSRPVFQNLETLLRQTIDLSEFDGTVGLYLKDLQTSQEIHFVYRQGIKLPTSPDAAFTASSTIKIPIMVSIFRRAGETPDPQILNNLAEMITKSENPSADWLIENILDRVRGPLVVTEDMRELGLEDTFLAGFFYQGAPLLEEIQTPANQRTDTLISRDRYSQTTPSEIGMLLEDIYQCAQMNGGALVAAFPAEITQGECQQMIDLLVRNRMPVLIAGGVPDGTRVAHKHGWVTDFNSGVIQDMSDASIVYSPGGNYVLTVFLYDPVQIVWDPVSKMVSDLSRAIYNYFNLPGQ